MSTTQASKKSAKTFADQREAETAIEWFDDRQIARMIGCSAGVIQKWRLQGRLRGVRFGRLTRVHRDELQRFFAARIAESSR